MSGMEEPQVMQEIGMVLLEGLTYENTGRRDWESNGGLQ
jgi:hypothetical protein